MNKKIILFDLDGTLIDSTEAILESFLKTLMHYNIDLKGREEEIESLIGMTLSDMFLHFGIQNHQIQECIKIYREYYREVFLEKTHLLPKVKETIENIPNSYKMAVVTSKSRLFSEQILEKLGLLQYFFTIIGIEDVKEPKPSAEPIFKALEKIDHDLSKVYMVGDTSFDMQAAKNAGIKGIGVSGRYQKNLSLHTQFVFENIEDALKHIKTEE